MKSLWLAVVTAVFCLGACDRPRVVGDGEARGRFAGIGIYSTDRLWSQLAGASAPKSAAAARLKDDQKVIVVVDTRTGEIRQCGNLSGYCVGLNPWARPLTDAQAAPLSLLKHEEDFEREDQAALDKAKSAASAQRQPSP
jgi:hypothetical protein